MPLSLQPLYGGGFLVAYAQLCAFYYVCAAVLHHLVPNLLPVTAIQHEQRKPGSVSRDAVYSLGGCACSGTHGSMANSRMPDAKRSPHHTLLDLLDRSTCHQGWGMDTGGGAASPWMEPNIRRACDIYLACKQLPPVLDSCQQCL